MDAYLINDPELITQTALLNLRLQIEAQKLEDMPFGLSSSYIL